ncbi:MAG: glycosyltransferase [Promethearchaeota archaeon]
MPAHNEEKTLRTTVQQVHDFLTKYSPIDFCILICEDGSTDNTKQIAFDLKKEFDNLIVISEKQKLGRGLALKNAWKQVEGDYYAFIDSDMAVPLKYFKKLLKAVLNDGYDAAIGSRYISGASVSRPKLRERVSRAYNSILKLFYNSPFEDHQCGFRIFSKKMVQAIISECRSDSWFLDTECLVLLHERFKIKEIPVVWKEHRRSKTELKRLYLDLKRHGSGLIRLYFVKARHQGYLFFIDDVIYKYIKFLLVGLFGFFYVLGMTYLVSLFVPTFRMLAVINSIIYFSAIVIQFFINKKLTFKSKNEKFYFQLPMDVIVRIIGWVLYEIFYLSLSPLMGGVIATIPSNLIVSLFNFIGNKFLVFGKKNPLSKLFDKKNVERKTEKDHQGI